VLAESSFADLSAMIAVQTTRLGPLGGLAARAVQWAAWCQLGLAVPDVSPRASLLTLPPSVPVILLHAGDDEVVPVDEGRRLAEARRGIELEVFPGASHGCCSTADPLRFRRLLGDLLDRVRRNAAR
jgi:pimeloyl-ACP methyl ester carboxylesterase